MFPFFQYSISLY